MSTLAPQHPLPRFLVVLHYFSGMRESAFRLVALHGGRILGEPRPLKGRADEGCVAVEVTLEANYAVLEHLQKALGLSVLCLRTGRFQVGFPVTNPLRIDGGMLDKLRRDSLPSY